MQGRQAERQHGRNARQDGRKAWRRPLALLAFGLPALLPFALTAFLPFCLPALQAAPPPPDQIDAMLDMASDYVAAYERTFVGVVAEEIYRQEVRDVSRPDARGFAVEG